MAGRKLSSLLFMVLTLMLLLMCGCGQIKPLQDEANKQGTLKVLADLNEINGNLTGMQLELCMKKDSTSLVHQVPMVDGVASLVVEDLLPGVWQVDLTVTDAEGYKQYQASAQVNIVTGTTTFAELQLQPCPGTLAVSADPSPYSALADAQKARLYVNPGGYSAMTANDDGTFTASKELPPGTYDYSITFYGTGYLVSDVVYESPWTTITIQPGKQLSLIWDPGTGSGSIGGLIDTPPPIPSKPYLQVTSEGLLVSWASVTASDLAGYRVYLRQNAFAKYEMICEQTPEQTMALRPTSKLDPGMVEVAVTAFDLAGNESERSPIASLIW